jgi:hypothetical protein
VTRIGLQTCRLGYEGLVLPRRTWNTGAYPVEELSDGAIPNHISRVVRLAGDREQRTDHQPNRKQVEEEPP